MFPTDFRQFALSGETGKAERLFRAAISAYCSLVRPTRREIAQLDDLTLPLYPHVPAATRRFAAAALSECASAPPLLVRRLINEPAEISAPLLVRSPAITDVDLIRLIGRHGLPHARVIARRKKLQPAIGALLDALNDPEIRRLRGRPEPALRAVPSSPPLPNSEQDAEEKQPLENVRRQLRAMMRPSDPTPPEPQVRDEPDDEKVFRRLRETALSGHLPLFQTALADALRIDLEAARRITQQPGYRDLSAALQSLGLSEEQAFLLIAALYPAVAGGAEAVRLFLYRYRLLAGQTAEALRNAAAPLAPPIRQAS